ncbi:hypothetical protein [Arthrobacter sp. AZCC_0090]|uniref:hypothetical protein n=1 Tax=Arthrobacter sp. AZCC_0090 TaxID=2735881 RepID=UPI0017BC0003|nr:hypothetical protein [Arthrobacter sp. AZCC_0090]MBB6402743.1 hypothetical protein [Arthrobacter sp. AZCC_0090]
MLAAVQREIAPDEVGSAWGPAVGKVWDFIRSQPDLWRDGHTMAAGGSGRLGAFGVHQNGSAGQRAAVAGTADSNSR